MALKSNDDWWFKLNDNEKQSIEKGILDADSKKLNSNEKANSVVEIEGMTGNERLYVSGLMDEFEKAKKSDKYKARTILQALKFNELSIGRIIGFSMDSLKYPNA